MKKLFIIILFISAFAKAQVNEADFPDGTSLPNATLLTPSLTDKVQIYDVNNKSNEVSTIADVLALLTLPDGSAWKNLDETTANQSSTSIKKGTTVDFASFSDTGDLTFTGNADYLIGSDDYAFRWSGDEDAGLLFNLSTASYEFRSTLDDTILQIGNDNNVAVPNGTLSVASTPTITTATKMLVKDPITNVISEQDFVAAIPETTSLTPKVFQAGVYNDADANLINNVADVVELSDGTYLSNDKVYYPSHGYTVGDYYFLDLTSGQVTNVVPSTGISQRLFYVVDADYLLIDVQPAYELSNAASSGITQGAAVTLSTNSTVSNNRVQVLTQGEGFTALTENTGQEVMMTFFENPDGTYSIILKKVN